MGSIIIVQLTDIFWLLMKLSIFSCLSFVFPFRLNSVYNFHSFFSFYGS